ncbi:MAG: DUF1684 domain-containing protein [Chloroflexi bacterium]|nr:DUF1684 domain-containing protein [Chloroflexota bacterium]
MTTGQRDETYADSIASGRLARDADYQTAAESPLRPGSKVRARSYFPIDERYRILVPRLRRPPDDDRPIALDTSDGQQRIARRLGMLDFELLGRHLTLTGFRMGSTPRGSLFVPFADSTTARETYRGGRYLDLEIANNGSVILDFNLAYHPYCAYSSAYSCPLAPAENRLRMSIRAGERMPP